MTEDVVLEPGMEIRPKIGEEDCKLLVERLYGLKCLEITELDGYDDKNYKISVSDVHKNNNIGCVCRDGYVLKILNSLDSRKLDFVEAQDQLLKYLEKNKISCPVPTPTVDGKYYTTENLISGEHVVRLMKYIPGEMIHKVPTSADLFYQAGQFIAVLDMTLKDFYHPAFKTHRSVWMMESVPNLRQFLYSIEDNQRRNIVERVIGDFEDRVIINAGNFEKGPIHGDFNEQNIVVENVNNRWLIKSILDFGDSQFSYYLFELAITMTYMMILAEDLDVGGFVIAGYTSIRRIPDEEVRLLKICVEARLCQSLVLSAYSSQRDPSNRYILTTSKPGWELLLKLNALSDEEVLKRWTIVADKYMVPNGVIVKV